MSGRALLQPGVVSDTDAAAAAMPVDNQSAGSTAIALAAVLQTAASLLWIPQAALLSMAVGNMAAGADAGAAVLPAAGIALIGVMRALLERSGARLAFDAARRHLATLRETAIDAVASRSPLDATRPSSGLVASTVAEQAEAVVPYLARFQPLRFKALAVPLVILAFILPISWTAALVLLVAAPLIPVFMALIGWQAREASERQLAETGSMNAFLLDRLRGLATIRTLGAVDRTALRLRAEAESLRGRTMAVLRIAFLSSAVLELFAALGVALVAVYVGFHLLEQLPFGAWGTKLSLAEGLFILLLAPAFFEPLRDLSSAWHDRAAGEAALGALAAASAPGPAMPGRSGETPREIAMGPVGVRIEDLRFRHAGQTGLVFDGFNLDIGPGEKVAIMAPSGGGKSSLLALVAGLATAEAGSIRIGGQPLHEGSAARLRAGMGWIGQTPHIFAGTLATNVSLARPGIGAAQIARAFVVARLDALALRRGAALIGEDGAGLSGGEALRLAIARAAATQGAGLILADEPTAHLDGETADAVTRSLLALSEGRTLIVTTHDPVLAGRMDRIIDLEADGASEGA